MSHPLHSTLRRCGSLFIELDSFLLAVTYYVTLVTPLNAASLCSSTAQHSLCTLNTTPQSAQLLISRHLCRIT